MASLDLDHLARVLMEIRGRQIKRLGGTAWLDQLPLNDPLRSPIGLFGTLDFGRLETAHTRTLAWLLNPSASHGFGDLLLRAWLTDLFGLDAAQQLSGVKIGSEAIVDDSRDRLDILMDGEWSCLGGNTEGWRVVVEANVDAAEGEKQCARYSDQCAAQRIPYACQRFVFLTPEGREPTTTSNNQEWLPRSFIHLMALFRRQWPQLTGKPGFDFLRLYITGVLKDLYQFKCGESQDRLEDCNIYQIGEFLSVS